MIVQLWSDRYPPDRPRRHGLAEKVVMTPVILSRLLSFDQAKVLFGGNGAHVFMDLYVLLFAFLVTTTLFLPNHLGRLGVIIAVYRILDIVTYRIYFLLVKSQDRPWSPDVLRRSLAIAVINFCETVVAYAIVYSFSGRIVASTTAILQHSFSPTTALYYSAVTATTLGYGDYVPSDDLSRMIVVSQLFTTIVFLIFVIPALVSTFSSRTSNDH